MWAIFLRQLANLLLTIFIAVTLAFFALRLLPGNAIDAQLQGSGLPPETIEARKAALGFDKPIHIQYVDYLIGLVSSDWGQSLYEGQTVLEIMHSRLPDTLSLASLSILLGIILGITSGLLSGFNTPVSPIFRTLTDLSLGIPIYFTATILLFVIASRIGGIQRGLFLPVLALGFHTSGALARIIESNLKTIQQAPFIQTARAKGLSSQAITRRHMLKLALLPAIPVIGLQAGILFSGTVITETIFGRPGLGLLLLDATMERDYPVVQGVVVLAAIFYLVMNQIANLTVHLLDPRLTT